MNRQLFEYDPMLGYRFIPRLKARMEHEDGGYLVRTNGLGFRSEHEFDAPRRSGIRRVLLFGDSFTAGDGVSNKKRYGDQLESLVDDVEVWNYGLPGSGTDQQYLIFRELAANTDHDLLIIAVLVENIRRVAARYRVAETGEGELRCLAKPYYSLEEGQLVLHHVPVPKGTVAEADLPSEQVDRGGRLPWLRTAINRMGPGAKKWAQKMTHFDPVPDYGDPDGPHWQLMSAILRHWIGEATRPVVLLPLPLYQHVEETSSAGAYRARFQEVAAASGAILHDPLDDLLEYSPQERRNFRFEVDIHPTPEAHRALAESLATIVRSSLPGGVGG